MTCRYNALSALSIESAALALRVRPMVKISTWMAGAISIKEKEIIIQPNTYIAES